MNDFPIVEVFVQVNVFLYVIEFDDGSMKEEFARRNEGTHSSTVRLSRYNNDICYVFDINVLFKAHR